MRKSRNPDGSMARLDYWREAGPCCGPIGVPGKVLASEVSRGLECLPILGGRYQKTGFQCGCRGASLMARS